MTKQRQGTGELGAQQRKKKKDYKEGKVPGALLAHDTGLPGHIKTSLVTGVTPAQPQQHIRIDNKIWRKRMTQ